MAYKPSSVSKRSKVYDDIISLLPYEGLDGNHLSSLDVAIEVMRPTRGWTEYPYPSIRPCTRWGLPSLQRYR